MLIVTLRAAIDHALGERGEGNQEACCPIMTARALGSAPVESEGRRVDVSVHD